MGGGDTLGYISNTCSLRHVLCDLCINMSIKVKPAETFFSLGANKFEMCSKLCVIQTYDSSHRRDLCHVHTISYHVQADPLQNLYSRVPTCQITTFYYVGFAYMMMRRYQDAIRTFANILLYVQRTKQMFQNRASLYDQVYSSFPLYSFVVVYIIYM